MTPSKSNPLSWLASLRLTVTLLALSMYLIFVGTLAQVENGIWWVVEHYFREGTYGIVWVDFDVFRSLVYPGSAGNVSIFGIESHPFPSGFVIIALLLVNLLAAHAVRYKMTGKGAALGAGFGLVFVGSAITAYTVLEPKTSAAIQQDVMLMMLIWTVPMTLIGIGCYFIFGSRKAGIVLIHGGIILMLVGEYITGIGADEGQMWIHEKGSSSKIIDIREVEIAFVTPTGDRTQEHIIIPQELIEAADEDDTLIENQTLPLTVRIDAWMENSDLLPSINGADPTQVQYRAEEVPAVTGTEQRADRPSVMATLFRGGERIGQHLLTTWEFVKPVEVEVDGKVWAVSLRFRETHLPYTIQLVDFRHDQFTGTTTPMNYSSTLRLEAPNSAESRDAFIKMNQPLRYDGKAFFQSGFFQQPLNRNLGTIMQVADNPGAWVPYLSCVIVTVGLCMHFVISLMRYGRRANARA
ncbi:MAG: cytochrome c biogenesis protein ResB [Planctomycetota bacterium]